MPAPTSLEELLIAWLDGELTGEERARAEQLLAENSEYRSLVDSWRQSGQRLRQLPKRKLDSGFADRVLSHIHTSNESVATKTPMIGPSNSLASNWRIGLAAIASLAALLMLTLFVFPRIGDQTPIANRTSEEVADSPAETMETEESRIAEKAFDDSRTTGSMESIDEVAEEKQSDRRRLGTAFGKGGSDKSDADDVDVVPFSEDRPDAFKGKQSKTRPELANQSDESFSLKKEAEPTLGQTEVLPKSQLADQAADPVPLSDELAMKPQRSKNSLRESGQVMSRSADEYGASPNQAPPVANAPTGSDSRLSDGDGRSGGLPGEALAGEQTASTQPVALQQVLWIDVPASTQPLKVVEEVLLRNRIQIVPQGYLLSHSSESIDSEAPDDGPGDPQTLPLQAGRMNKKSAKDVADASTPSVEAISVVSTTAQMKQAIREISQQAHVVGYQIPQNQSVQLPLVIDNVPASTELQAAENQPKPNQNRDEGIGLDWASKPGASEIDPKQSDQFQQKRQLAQFSANAQRLQDYRLSSLAPKNEAQEFEDYQFRQQPLGERSKLAKRDLNEQPQLGADVVDNNSQVRGNFGKSKSDADAPTDADIPSQFRGRDKQESSIAGKMSEAPEPAGRKTSDEMAEVDRYFGMNPDESDSQLNQYLIIVRISPALPLPAVSPSSASSMRALESKSDAVDTESNATSEQ